MGWIVKLSREYIIELINWSDEFFVHYRLEINIDNQSKVQTHAWSLQCIQCSSSGKEASIFFVLPCHVAENMLLKVFTNQILRWDFGSRGAIIK